METPKYSVMIEPPGPVIDSVKMTDVYRDQLSDMESDMEAVLVVLKLIKNDYAAMLCYFIEERISMIKDLLAEGDRDE